MFLNEVNDHFNLTTLCSIMYDTPVLISLYVYIYIQKIKPQICNFSVLHMQIAQLQLNSHVYGVAI